ncbi:MAG: dihydropteroate synthase [Candidatus Nanopelagicales bacterium]|jgi:dihydropteroate synthase
MRHPLGLVPALAGLDRTVVMGILNVTPDSFSDGGRWTSVDAAIDRGRQLHADGADIVDVGGESTRPGAQRIDAVQEADRVVPVVAALSADGIPVSIDTMRAEVAAAGLDAGAVVINDVSGGMADPRMLPWLASVSVPYVAMHWRGPSDVMEELARYDDVVEEVIGELRSRLHQIEAAGVDPRRVILDPGLGFAKRSMHNWPLLASLDRLQALGCPLLIGASRKRFLGDVLADSEGPRPLDGRDAAGDAVTALAAASGAWGVRVHEVRASRDAVLVARAWVGAR